MITWHDLYVVLTAVIPLYAAMILAYGSVRWWKIFTADQCAGINRFVAVFAVPLLSFHFISENDPYSMNFRFIAGDTLQKLVILLVLAGWAALTGNGSLDWSITIFSLSSLPNTLVMGIPLLTAMYGGEYSSGSLMVQVVVLQCIIWYTLLLFLFEYRAAKVLIMEQFPETAASIVSFKVESDVVSLDVGLDSLETDAEVGSDGMLRVRVRRRSISVTTTPRPSNLTGVEIYSLHTSRNPTPRGSDFNPNDLYSMMGFPDRLSNFGPADIYSVQSSRGPTPRPSDFEENCDPAGTNNVINSSSMAELYTGRSGAYPAPNPEITSLAPKSSKKEAEHQLLSQSKSLPVQSKNSYDAKELHMFIWSSSTSPASAAGGVHVFGGSDFGADESSGRSDGVKEIRMLVSDRLPRNWETKPIINSDMEGCSFYPFGEAKEGHEEKSEKEVQLPTKMGSASPAQPPDSGRRKPMPPASVMTRLILIMVWRKLIRNPNTYSSLIGLIWSLISYRWHVHMPKIIDKSISILSDAGLGMAMFSLGLFMALQPKIISCGNRVATVAMAVRFLIGPAIMAATSAVVGLRGALLHIAIVQGYFWNDDRVTHHTGVLHCFRIIIDSILEVVII
ncbi:unnamed protein product [Cuscuta epithymum]|uniref:Auxin efflux carrier component n=1 Tax=Cuscuta epithymum TaxID=186058 RepID=A0AAV0GEJ0_9ASTE|nr:unnamed protein product [Cuscuta epithymum]